MCAYMVPIAKETSVSKIVNIADQVIQRCDIPVHFKMTFCHLILLPFLICFAL